MYESYFYVSLEGQDSWSGRLPAPSADGTDGPFATVDRAKEAVSELKRAGQLNGNISVLLRGGKHRRSKPLVFSPEDSAPVTYASYPGEWAIVDGGERIVGWRADKVAGTPCWVAELPAVASGEWYFRQLFVNGERRPRPRLPKQGYYRIRDTVPPLDLENRSFSEEALFAGTSSFRCDPADLQDWRNLCDIDVVALHWWIEERLPVARLDRASSTIVSSRRSMFALRDDTEPRYARYYFDNVFEALTEPGEWYLDRPTGRLYYLPLPGEDPRECEVVAPKAEQLVVLRGEPECNAYVEFLCLKELGFEHADWRQPEGWHPLFGSGEVEWPRREPGVDFAGAPQAACNVPGALVFEGARYCVIEDCHIARVGGYAVEFGEGCIANRVSSNKMTDLGAGGVKVFGADARGRPCRRTGGLVISDNEISAGGRVFPSAVGILVAHAANNTISYNLIHDLFYSGISCGWVWGYGENTCHDNRIEHNHIYDLGHCELSDLGGIYTLGVQPGTVVRRNLVHDVWHKNYGGQGIYLDEGSSHIVVEGNVCYDTGSHAFFVHYGRENVVRRNLFAYGREGTVGVGRAEEHNTCTFTENVLMTANRLLYTGGRNCSLMEQPFLSDMNVLWDVEGRDLVSGDRLVQGAGEMAFDKAYDVAALRRLGIDRHSFVVDPQLRDAANRDFVFSPGSPALEMGIEPLDVTEVGPRATSAAPRREP